MAIYPIHLLDLLRFSLVPPKDPNAENQPINQQGNTFTRSFPSSSATDPNAENQSINQQRDNFTRSFSSSSATELTTTNEPTLTDQSMELPHPKQSQDIMHEPVLLMAKRPYPTQSQVIMHEPVLPMAKKSYITQSQFIMPANYFKRIIGWIKLFPKLKSHQHSFRRVGDLKKAGISFRPSEEHYLGDAVKFIPKYFISGRLELPQLIVDDSMAPQFLNLIAYEMCPGVKTNYEVSAYMSFLGFLLDNPNDVKELCNSSVLFNYLGSDEGVTNLFNEISTDLVFHVSIYQMVIRNIEQHYNSKIRIRTCTWMAQVYQDHFSSPWTIVAFLAAIAVFFMTIVQSWRALFPPPGPCDGVCNNLRKLIQTTTFCDYFCYNRTVSPASCVQVCKALKSVWK